MERRVSVLRPSVCPTVCLSRRSTAAEAAGGFAAELGRGQHAAIDLISAQPRDHVGSTVSVTRTSMRRLRVSVGVRC